MCEGLGKYIESIFCHMIQSNRQVTFILACNVACVCSWNSGSVDDIRFLHRRNLIIQMSIEKTQQKSIWSCQTCWVEVRKLYPLWLMCHFFPKYVGIGKAEKIGTMNYCFGKKINTNEFLGGLSGLISECLFYLGWENRGRESRFWLKDNYK